MPYFLVRCSWQALTCDLPLMGIFITGPEHRTSPPFSAEKAFISKAQENTPSPRAFHWSTLTCVDDNHDTGNTDKIIAWVNLLVTIKKQSPLTLVTLLWRSQYLLGLTFKDSHMYHQRWLSFHLTQTQNLVISVLFSCLLMKQFEGKPAWDLCTTHQQASKNWPSSCWYCLPSSGTGSLGISEIIWGLWHTLYLLIGTDISELTLLPVPHVMAYSLALMLSWLLGGRTTAVPTPSLRHQPFPSAEPLRFSTFGPELLWQEGQSHALGTEAQCLFL